MPFKKRYCVALLISAVILIFSCKKEVSCEGCRDGNQPPIAIAGPDQSISLPTDSIMLDGNASRDPDGSIVRFQWRKISGPGTINIGNTSSPGTVVRNLISGAYFFELRVTDNGGSSATDSLLVVVSDPSQPNRSPVANAGPDQVIFLPSNSTLLDGMASTDPDNNIISYKWSKIAGPSPGVIVSNTSVQTQVTNLMKGNYDFELEVRDAGGLYSKDTMQVIVAEIEHSNRPPVARAGSDITLSLPTNSTPIDGSSSFDPDSNITSYRWSKIGGPASFILTNAQTAQSMVTGLVEGIYYVELKVTDAGGLFSTDTIQITVVNGPPPPAACNNLNRPFVPATLVAFGSLSQAREGIAVISAENKILFAGGYLPPGGFSSRVDIYDQLTQTWTTAELSVPRCLMATVAAGGKIFFAGGETGDGTWPVSTVDIYDIANNTWSVTQLSIAGNSIIGAAVGNKILFAGGDGGFSGPGRETRVDIYDLVTNSWSTASLSEAKRGFHAGVTYNNKVYFTGGETFNQSGNWGASNKIDIYNNANGSWSTSVLSQGKMGLLGITSGHKIYWAGGQTGWAPVMSMTCSVEIFDMNTGANSHQYLFGPALWSISSGQNAAIKNNKIIFYRPYSPENNKFDIYDVISNSWSIGTLGQPVPEGASIYSLNNIIYVVGGIVNGVQSTTIWKLEF
jgi:hypothetical protein